MRSENCANHKRTFPTLHKLPCGFSRNVTIFFVGFISCTHGLLPATQKNSSVFSNTAHQPNEKHMQKSSATHTFCRNVMSCEKSAYIRISWGFLIFAKVRERESRSFFSFFILKFLFFFVVSLGFSFRHSHCFTFFGSFFLLCFRRGCACSVCGWRCR